MAASVNAEVAWNCCFVAHTALLGIADPSHLYELEPLSLDWIAFLFFFFPFKICTLQVGMMVSWGYQESRRLLIRVVTTDYKFYHGECNTNTTGKLWGKGPDGFNGLGGLVIL